jgi:type IV pilus assembly protein PilP
MQLKAPKALIAAAAQAAAEEEFFYNPVDKRDPFRSIVSTREDDKIKSPTPLQRFELEQYTLSGIIWGIERPKAMVEDPEQIGHVVELGTYIGTKWGKVTEITENHIVVTEEYLSMDGSLVVKPRVLSLPGEETTGSRW